MLNCMHLHGRMCADPELRTTQSGVSVCSFRVAWSETYNERETKLFLPCTAWRGTGEAIAKYFAKGKEIVVSGSLSTRDWEDKDGNKRTSIEMTVNEFDFCGPKDGGSSGGSGGGSNSYSAGEPGDYSFGGTRQDYPEIDDDESGLPF